MCERVINKLLFPKLAHIGQMHTPMKFVFLNDDEVQETIERENLNAQGLAGVAKTMSEAGMNMSPEYFTQQTGVPATAIVVPPPILPPADKTDVPDKIKNKLDKLYRISA